MSESGCLHSSKFENVKVEKHMSSNNILITGEVSVGDTEDHTGDVDDNGITTQVLTTEYDFNNRTDKASTGISGISGVPLESDDNYLSDSIGSSFNNVFSKKKSGVETVSNIRDRHYYVRWPSGTILKELTIIPNMDIKSAKIAGETTLLRFKNELVINLLTSEAVDSSWGDDTSLEHYNSQEEADARFKSILETIDTDDLTRNSGAKLIGHFPNRHAKQVSRGYGYLIREFPIISCALNADSANIRWRKYTPISVIRDMGQPIGFSKDGDGNPISQHSTASTTEQLKHGSRIDSSNEGLPKGCVATGLRVDSGSGAMNVNKTGEPGLFSFSTAYRNVAPIIYAGGNMTTRIGQCTSIKNTYTDGEFGTTTDEPRHEYRSGMFYNSGSQDLGLILTIGHTSDKNETDASTWQGGRGTLTKGDGSNFDAGANGLKFKAIFTFMPFAS